MESEIEFLKDLREEYWSKHFSMVLHKIVERIKELEKND